MRTKPKPLLLLRVSIANFPAALPPRGVVPNISLESLWSGGKQSRRALPNRLPTSGI